MSFRELYIDGMDFIRGIFDKRQMLMELARRDMLQANRGTYLGIIWNYFQPLLFILLLWFVFGIGLRGGHDIYGTPFLLYLICGMTAWNYFSENLNSTANILNEYSFLVKKVDFSLGTLPVVRLISSTIPHLVFIAMSIIISIIYSKFSPISVIQIVYYYLAMSLFLLGISWLTSSTSLFVNDIKNVTKVIVQFGFWLSPIFWHINMIPENLQWIAKLNPMHYILTGYRDSIFNGIPFWAKQGETIYFWSLTIIFILAGAIVFKRLKPHFEEVI